MISSSYSSWNAPLRSGIVTAMGTSDESARSETKRRRSKSMLAPEQMATSAPAAGSCESRWYIERGGCGGCCSPPSPASPAPADAASAAAATIASCSSRTNLVMPATASAPAGSTMVRVSLKVALIASHTWSVVTVMMPSAWAWHSRNVSAPTRRTAAPSANNPTVASSTTSPARSDVAMPAASAVSTPYTFTSGATRFTYLVVVRCNNERSE